jgi:sugar phosphate isomerase/epimerase
MNRSQRSRRRAIGQLTTLGAAVLAPWKQTLGQLRTVENIGLQLYTLRRELAGDFEGTLARVAELGYREVEFAGYFERDPAAVRRTLDLLGLSSPAAHIQLQALRDNLQGEIETALALGQQYIVVPIVPDTERSLDHYHRHADFLNRAGEACREAGLVMGYHNHAFEFERTDGQLPYDILLNETDPELVAMEMDLFWISYAGVDPVAYFERFPGRFPMLHVKDLGAGRSMQSVGEGNIDFARLFAFQETAGFRHFFVEHDNPDDAVASITTSIRNLRGLVY